MISTQASEQNALNTETLLTSVMVFCNVCVVTLGNHIGKSVQNHNRIFHRLLIYHIMKLSSHKFDSLKTILCKGIVVKELTYTF